MKNSKTKWLDRRIAAPGPRLALCLTESEYVKAVESLGVKSRNPWLAKDAATHWFEGSGGLSAVVCLDGSSAFGRNPVEVHGLLVHEAVHVWQAYAKQIGEEYPGQEQEAYAIQAISQELMAEFLRRMERK